MKHHPRELLNRMLHLVKSGLQWRMLPVGFPPWRAAHYHFRKWQRQNLFQKLTGRIRRAARVTEGRRPSPSAAIVDSQSVPTGRQGGLSRGRDPSKQVKGRKRHVITLCIGPSARRAGRTCKRFGRSTPAGLASATARKSPTPEGDLRRRRIRGRASKLNVAVLSLDAPRRKPRRFPAGLHASAEALGRRKNVWMV